MPKSASDSSSLAPSRKFDRDMQIPPETQVVIDFDDNRAASALVGPYGQNLALIERRLGVVVDSRGNHITIAGSRDGCDAARSVEKLDARGEGHEPGGQEGAIRAVIAQACSNSSRRPGTRSRPSICATSGAGAPAPRIPNPRQRQLGCSASAPPAPARPRLRWRMPQFERKEVDRIICRGPAEPATARLPARRSPRRSIVSAPIYDALYDLMDARVVERAPEAAKSRSRRRLHARPHVQIIHHHPRQAQNTTSMQMKMFLTRREQP